MFAYTVINVHSAEKNNALLHAPHNCRSCIERRRKDSLEK